MTAKEFSVIGKELLSYLPGFALKGRLVFIKPIVHTLRAIYFDASGFDRKFFYVNVFLQPLAIRVDHFIFSAGWRLGKLWTADAPDLIPQLRKIIHAEALPFLARAESPQGAAAAAIALQKSEDPGVQQVIAYSFARAGEITKASNALDRFVRLLNVTFEGQRKMADEAMQLRAQLLSRPDEAQRQLDMWEMETVRNLRLEEFR